ncbi:MAG TPA: EamA family transporter, partial [Clostridiales bacterium]|nr:EamA family transporter [Clostridiales bacterium]
LNVLLRRRIPANGKFAIVFAVLGFYIMCINGDSGLTYADAMLLLCA